MPASRLGDQEEMRQAGGDLTEPLGVGEAFRAEDTESAKALKGDHTQHVQAAAGVSGVDWWSG